VSNFDDTEGWPYREAPASAFRPVEPDPEPEPVAEPEPEPDPEPAADEAAPQLDLEEDELPIHEPITPDPIRPEAAEAADAALAPVVEEEEEEAEAEPAEEPEEPEEPEEELAAEHAVGELDVPDGYAILAGSPVGERRTIGIVVGRFNGEITNDLLKSALDELEEAGVARDAVTIMPVPGAFELPLAAMALAKTRRYACVIALGCVIRGETPHFDFVAGEAASGLQLAAVETGVPVSFGVLTCDTREQAEARVGKGAEAVRAGLEMADLFAQLRAQARG
jgi:6,7-dimethyl-8-ribityllumazine synthase